MRSRGTSRIGDVEFRRVSDGGWLVRAADRPTSDPSAVLGFIEEDGAQFAITELSRPGTRRRVATLQAARAAFTGGDTMQLGSVTPVATDSSLPRSA